MNLRTTCAVGFGFLGLVAAYLTVSLRQVDASSIGFFGVMAVFFLVLAWAAARPTRPPEAPATGFASSVFLELSLLIVTVLVVLALAAHFYRRLKGHA